VRKASDMRGPKPLLADQLRELGEYYASRKFTGDGKVADMVKAGEILLRRLAVLEQDPATPKPELIRNLDADRVDAEIETLKLQ
jgi:hypothetical protein